MYVICYIYIYVYIYLYIYISTYVYIYLVSTPPPTLMWVGQFSKGSVRLEVRDFTM